MAKYASIDIGSNTLLLLITDDQSGAPVAIVDECDFGRLGQGLAHSSELHPDAVARSLEVVRRYRTLMDAHELSGVACVGTQALREATNRQEFIGPAEAILGCPIEIISGDREAQLVSTAILRDFPDLCSEEVVCVDVGGASTEFIRIRDGEQVSVVSLPIGAVRLSEAHLTADPPTEACAKNLYEAIDAQLDTLELPRSAHVIGSAGTATSIASIDLELAEYDPGPIHACSLSSESVRSIARDLLAKSVAEKRGLVGLAPERADVIAGGVAIYDCVLRRLSAPSLVISDRGVRWGLAYELASS